MAKMSEIPIWETPEEEREALRKAVEEARKSVREGRVVPHALVREWLNELAAGKDSPPPRPWRK